jgi:hypothetical protein
MEQKPSRFLIETPDGGTVDLGPLIEAAQGIRHNAMIDREHGEETALSRIHVAATMMGMKIAVRTLLGDEVLSTVELHVGGTP